MARKRRVYREEPDNDKVVNFSLPQELYDRMDEHQRHYATEIRKNKVVMVDAPAGTGKTTVAVLIGFEMLLKGKVDKILYVRIPDPRALGQGFLPGDPKEKQRVFMYPFYDAASECGISAELIDKLIALDMVELATDMTMRGRNVKKSFEIIDEAQNSNISDLQLLLTRIHDNGKTVVIGHSKQQDGKYKTYGKERLNAFQVYQYHMSKRPWTSLCNLPVNYRGVVSQWADEVESSIQELERS